MSYLEFVGILARVIAKIAANIAALWIAAAYVAGFTLTGGIPALIIGGIVLAGINLVVRPILKLVSLPFLVITLGAFYIIIFIVILVLADFLLPQLTISGLSALIWGAIIIGMVNTFIK